VEVKQILHLAHNKSDIERRVRAVIDKFAERGLRALGVAYQVYDPLTCTIATLFD
jgi:magnesium-transporting ATPase (P-type)